MKKIAIFTEGQGELIFVRYLLALTIRADRLSFKCFSLKADRLYPVSYDSCPPNAQIHFLLVNVGNDERVISAIAEREENLVNKGYDRVIGLRDMYSEAYRKHSTVIDHSVNESFIQEHESVIQQMSNSDKIRVFFAIMELEAWLLAMYNLFAKIHPDLTCPFIESQLGFNLEDIDPQTEFFHPSVQLGQVLTLIGQRYIKSRSQIESILSRMDATDVDNAHENGRCTTFATFLTEITNFPNLLPAEPY